MVTDLESSPFLDGVDTLSPAMMMIVFKLVWTQVMKDVRGCNACHNRDEVVVRSKDKENNV